MSSENSKPLKLKIRLPGEDDKTVISIRIKEEFIERIDEIAKKTNRSRNELLCMMVEYGLQNVEIDHRIDNDKIKKEQSN